MTPLPTPLNVNDPAYQADVQKVRDQWQNAIGVPQQVVDSSGTGAIVTVTQPVVYIGGWEDFQAAVALGWVPFTPDGYGVWSSWMGASSEVRLRAKLFEFTGWMMARQKLAGSTAQASIAAWIQNGYITAAEGNQVLAAFVQYGGLLALPAGPSAGPDPSYPVGVQLLLANPPGNYSFGQAVAVVVGWQTLTVQVNGSSVASGWQTTPAVWNTVLPIEWRGGDLPLQGIRGSRWVGLDPDNSTPFWQQQAAAALADSFTQQRLTDDTAAFTAWIKDKLPTYAPSGLGVVATIPTPAPVPYIPGSQVFIPAPGSGLEATILLPGATTPVPVSTLPPELQQANQSGLGLTPNVQGTGWVDVADDAPTGPLPSPVLSGPIRPTGSLPTGGVSASVVTATPRVTPATPGPLGVSPSPQVAKQAIGGVLLVVLGVIVLVALAASMRRH